MSSVREIDATVHVVLSGSRSDPASSTYSQLRALRNGKQFNVPSNRHASFFEQRKEMFPTATRLEREHQEHRHSIDGTTFVI